MGPGGASQKGVDAKNCPLLKIFCKDFSSAKNTAYPEQNRSHLPSIMQKHLSNS